MPAIISRRQQKLSRPLGPARLGKQLQQFKDDYRKWSNIGVTKPVERVSGDLVHVDTKVQMRPVGAPGLTDST